MARTTGSNAQNTARKLRKSAMQLFAQNGYAAVSMRQIAADVGVQVGALYNYTDDKQSLLLDLLQTHMNELLVALNAELENTSDPLAQLEAFTKFHIRYHMQRPDAVFISYMELRNLTPENFKTIEHLRRQYEARLEQCLREGVQAGVFQLTDTKVTTRAVIAMLNGVLTWFRAQGELSLSSVEDIYWDMVRKAVSA